LVHGADVLPCADFVYFTDHGTPNADGGQPLATGSVRRCPHAGCPTGPGEALAESLRAPFFFSRGCEEIVYGDQFSASILLDAGPPHVLLTEQAPILGGSAFRDRPIAGSMPLATLVWGTANTFHACELVNCAQSKLAYPTEPGIGNLRHYASASTAVWSASADGGTIRIGGTQTGPYASLTPGDQGDISDIQVGTFGIYFLRANGDLVHTDFEGQDASIADVVISGLPTPGTFAVNTGSNAVYVAGRASGDIVRVDVQNRVVAPLARGRTSPSRLAYDNGTYVYWAEPTQIMRLRVR
jgi:hypothetical protein